MKEFVASAYELFCVGAALFGIYFALISGGCLLRRRKMPEAGGKLRFAVLTAARNEASCIASFVESIRRQRYPEELVDIYVVVNNCTDNTAKAAAAAGAEVIFASPAVRSKGDALREGFDILMRSKEYDAYCVFDADNEASGNFLAEMNRALCGGARVAKSRILAKNAEESLIAACYGIFFSNANTLLNGARARLGISARVIGTGFAVRHDLMEELGGWNTKTLTEDAEFYAMLAERGERVAFVPEAVTYDEEPLTFGESMIQRRRWMSGIMEVGRDAFVPLMKSAVCGRGGRQAVDALVQLSFARVQALMLPIFFLWFAFAPEEALRCLPELAVRFYIGAVATGGLALAMDKRAAGAEIKGLWLYPLFIFSFLPLQTLALVRPNRVWRPIRHTGVRRGEGKNRRLDTVV